MKFEYSPDLGKATIEAKYVNYRYDTQYVTIPILVTNDKNSDLIIINHEIYASSVSPFEPSDLFVGKFEFPIGTKIDKDAKDYAINARLRVSYERLNQIENYRKELPQKEKRADVTMRITGSLVYSQYTDNSIHVEPVIIEERKSKYITIIDTDWQQLLQWLGYPKTRQILITEETYGLLKEYMVLISEPNTERALEQSLIDAIRAKRSKSV